METKETLKILQENNELISEYQILPYSDGTIQIYRNTCSHSQEPVRVRGEGPQPVAHNLWKTHKHEARGKICKEGETVYGHGSMIHDKSAEENKTNQPSLSQCKETHQTLYLLIVVTGQLASNGI